MMLKMKIYHRMFPDVGLLEEPVEVSSDKIVLDIGLQPVKHRVLMGVLALTIEDATFLQEFPTESPLGADGAPSASVHPMACATIDLDDHSSPSRLAA